MAEVKTVKNKKGIRIFGIAIGALFFAAVILTAVLVATGNVASDFGGSAVSSLDDGWSASGASLSLPTTVAAEGGKVVLSRALPDTVGENYTLAFLTKDKGVSVSVGGDARYSFNDNTTIQGKKWNFVPLDESDAGKTVTVTLTAADGKSEMTVYGMTVGREADIQGKLIGGSADIIIVCSVLLVTAIVLIVATFITGRKMLKYDPHGFGYLGLFMLLAAVWIATDSTVLQFFTGDISLSFFLSFASFMLFPIPLIKFFGTICEKRRTVLDILAAVFLVNFFSNIILWVSAQKSFTDTLTITHIIMILAVVVVIALCIEELFKNKNHEAGILLGAIVLFAVVSAGSILAFYNGNTPESNSQLFRYGLLAFALMLSLSVCYRAARYFSRTESFERIAGEICCGVCRVKNDATFTIVYANKFYYDLLGYTEEEAKEVKLTSIAETAHIDGKRAFNLVAESIKNGKSEFELEHSVVRSDGQVVPLLVKCHYDKKADEIIAAVISIEQRKKAEKLLLESEEEYRIAANHSGKLILRYEVASGTAFLQDAASEQFGMPRAVRNFREEMIKTGVIGEDNSDIFEGMFNDIISAKPEGSYIMQMRAAQSGDYAWMHADYTSIFDKDRKPIFAVISIYDITAQHEKELAYEKWQQQFEELPREAIKYYEYNLTDDLYISENGKLLPKIAQKGNKRKLDSFAKYTADNFVFAEDKEKFIEFYSRHRLLDCYAHGVRGETLEFRRAGDNNQLWTQASYQLILDQYSNDIQCYILIKDIHEQKIAEIDLLARSRTDPLTSLLNRSSFIEQFNLMKARCKKCYLALIDIDNFKEVNDNFGHGYGDTVLIDIANKLHSSLGTGDICGRLGGDEFILCLEDDEFGKPITDRMTDLCKLLYKEYNSRLRTSASIGVVTYPDCGEEFEALYKRSDIALYRAKDTGRNRFVFFDMSMDDPYWQPCSQK